MRRTERLHPAGAAFAACLAVLITVVWSCPPAAAEPPDVYIIGGDENFPPYEFVVDVNGEKVYRGFNVDIMKAIALQTGIEVEFRPMVWAEALKALDEGRIDAVQGMKYSEERASRYNFSSSYVTNVQAVFVLKTSGAMDMDDLRGKKIAVQMGDIAYQRLKDDPAYHLITASDQEAAFRLMLSGSVDAVLGNKLVGQYILQRDRQVGRVRLIDREIDPQKYAVAVRKGDDELLQTLNRGIYEIKKNGTYDRIYEKWFGEPLDYPSAYYKQRLLVMFCVLGTLFLALALAMYLNFVLQREVRRRMAREKRLLEKIAHKDKLESLGTLVAGIAHEIRTPITSIKTFVELLPQKYDNPVFRERISRLVPQEVERMDSILNSLLDYAKPRKPLPQDTNLLELVRGILALLDSIIEKDGIYVAVDIDGDIAVHVDRGQMQQVFINIVLNAIEAMQGRATREIRISASRRDGEVVAVFQDTGEGIDGGHLKRVFDPFFTTKPSGTGLGLAVSYQIVNENDGRIWIESTPGEGTKVFVALPRRKNGVGT